VGLEEFREPDRPLSSDLLNHVVCARKHPILVVLCNLRKVLPEGVGVVRRSRALGNQSLQSPGIHLLITQRFADNLADLGGNFGEGVLFFSVEPVYLSFVPVRREKDFQSRRVVAAERLSSSCCIESAQSHRARARALPTRASDTALKLPITNRRKPASDHLWVSRQPAQNFAQLPDAFFIKNLDH
jgi:hypothetical protein